MSPLQIEKLLEAAQAGQTEALTRVDSAFEQIVLEGSERDLAETVQIIENFLSEAISQARVPNAA